MRRINQVKVKIAAMAMICVLAVGLTGCAVTEVSKNQGKNSDVTYQLTEEANLEAEITNAPTSSYWFPSELLEWNSDEDPDFLHNVSTVPLQKRVDKEKLTPANETQNKDTKVMAISIMNRSTSGMPSRGRSSFSANTFSYWQYIDTLVYWGGSSGEGLIVAPSPDVTDAAHKNGVPVIGTIFFPMMEHGGKIEWLNTFLQKDGTGAFPMIDKLIEVAQKMGFDGWFINQETQVDLTKEHAVLMQEFIKAYKAKAPEEMQIIWYDSMTKEGLMDWQNELTEENQVFLIDENKNTLADKSRRSGD